MAGGRPITRWNLFALVAVVIGTALTLGFDRWWLAAWSASGIQIPVGERVHVDLPAGSTRVYYESSFKVPVPGLAALSVRDEEGQRKLVSPLFDDESFSLRRTGWSSRALWELDIDEPGTYQLICLNFGHETDDAVPASDRIVLHKKPNSVSEARKVQGLIRTSGAFITIVVVGMLYTVHISTLRGGTRNGSPRIPDA